MKSRKTIILYFVLLVFIGFYSCNEVDYDGPNYSVDTPPAFLRVYRNESDFTASYDDDGDYEYTEWESEAEDHKDYTDQKVTRWVDGRTPEGYSTWSHPEHTFTFNVDATQVAYDALGKRDKDNHKHIYKGTINMSSPPAHLHLCLNSWNEDYYNYYHYNMNFKTWQIESITNDSGQSLAEDPDWTNYTDNLMTFYKASKFEYTPGQKRSETEVDFFEAYPKNTTITGTYTVVEDASKKVTLTVNFPKFSESFEVVESSWDGLTLKGTVKGKTGFMHLMPNK